MSTERTSNYNRIDESLQRELRHSVHNILEMFGRSGIANPNTILDCINFLIVLRHLCIPNNINKLSIDAFDELNLAILGKPHQIPWDKIANEIYDCLFPNRHFSTHFKECPDIAAWASCAFDILFTQKRRRELVSAVDDLLEQSQRKGLSGDLYDTIIERLSQQGGNFHPLMPRVLAQTMIEMIGGNIFDLYCHTGVILAEAGSGAGLVPLGSPFGLVSIYLYMHGIDLADSHIGLAYRNALIHPDESMMKKLHLDTIFCCPPFNVTIADDAFDQSILPELFWTRKSDILYPLLALRMLPEGGRCGMILPARVFQTTDRTTREFRKYLLENACVEAVVYLPTGGYVNISYVFLIFSKGRQTDSVFF